jgi:hypothetical protein
VRPIASIAVAVAVVVPVGAGCGDGEDADRDEITAVLNQLFEAQEAGDAKTACRDVYVIQEPPPPGSEDLTEVAGAEAEAEEAEGEGGREGVKACEVAFEQADQRRRREISDLSTEIGAIELDGDRATAIVHTELRRRDGSELSQDAPYDLVRTPEGWRIRISAEG